MVMGERIQVTVDGPPVTVEISLRQVEEYLRGRGWGLLESERWNQWNTGWMVAHTPRHGLGDWHPSDVVRGIAHHEKRPAYEVLRDIAAVVLPRPELQNYAERRRLELAKFDQENPNYAGERCHSGRDGDCYWARCPQHVDGKRLSHCPLDRREEDE